MVRLLLSLHIRDARSAVGGGSTTFRRPVEQAGTFLSDLPVRLGESLHGRLERAAAVASTTPQNKLRAPHKLHHISAHDLTVLDLRTSAAQLTVGLEPADLTNDDSTACQEVGHAAWFLHIQAILVPSAGGVGLVITAYEQRIRPGQLTVLRTDDLTPETYERLRGPS
jgi:RES domain-containing protein